MNALDQAPDRIKKVLAKQGPSTHESLLGRMPSEGHNRIAASSLARVAFDPTLPACTPLPSSARSELEARPADSSPEIDWAHIATALTSGRAILRASKQVRRRARDLQTTFIAPSPGLESDIARIWEDILAVSPVGAQDSFEDLGGKSIDLVQVHSRLARLLGRSLDLTLLFECSTPARLARRLGDRDAPVGLSADVRASAMARARVDHGRRLKEIRESL